MITENKQGTITDTPEEFEAITWWVSFSPAEQMALRDKYAFGFGLIDMPKKIIVSIWKQANNTDNP